MRLHPTLVTLRLAAKRADDCSNLLQRKRLLGEAPEEIAFLERAERSLGQLAVLAMVRWAEAGCPVPEVPEKLSEVLRASKVWADMTAQIAAEGRCAFTENEALVRTGWDATVYEWIAQGAPGWELAAPPPAPSAQAAAQQEN